MYDTFSVIVTVHFTANDTGKVYSNSYSTEFQSDDLIKLYENVNSFVTLDSLYEYLLKRYRNIYGNTFEFEPYDISCSFSNIVRKTEFKYGCFPWDME